MNTCQVDGLVVQRAHTTLSAPGHPGHQTWQCVISSCGVSSRKMFTSHHFQKHYQNCESASTPQSGTSHKKCLRGFGGNGSIAWTSAVSHEGRTSNAFKVTMKLKTFPFQMVVILCVSVQYLWKYGFAKSSENLCAPCIYGMCYISHQYQSILLAKNIRRILQSVKLQLMKLWFSVFNLPNAVVLLPMIILLRRDTT